MTTLLDQGTKELEQARLYELFMGPGVETEAWGEDKTNWTDALGPTGDTIV